MDKVPSADQECRKDVRGMGVVNGEVWAWSMVRYGRGQYRGMGVVNIEVWAWSMVKYGGVVNCTVTSSSKETSDMFTANPSGWIMILYAVRQSKC